MESLDRGERGPVRRAAAVVGRPSRYDVCPVVGLRTGSAVDLAVVPQDDQLSDPATRVVAPLIAIRDHDVDRATIAVEIEGVRYVAAVHLLTTVPTRNLGRPIANLEAHERALKNAIDLVFFGI